MFINRRELHNVRKGSKHRRRHEPRVAVSPAPKSKSRLRLLVTLLVLSVLSGVALSRLNSKEVTTQESAESLELKRQMLEQFMQRQGGAEAAPGAVAQAPAS